MLRTKEEMKAAAMKAAMDRYEELYKTDDIPINTAADRFKSDCEDLTPRIGTGYPELDQALNGGLANELYILGAETSTGKSAFLMSVAQNVAEQGFDVLYFSLEMGKKEFIARGTSGISFEHWVSDSAAKRVTAADVLYWRWDKTLEDFTRVPYKAFSSYTDEYFRRYGEHLRIIEGGAGGGLTVQDIVGLCKLHKAKTGKPPVVMIDYLQIIRPDPEDRTQADRKTKMDTTVTALKALASQVGMPVVTISSIGRTKYRHKVSKESFKESGDIEYTGGVLLGWNWLGVTDAGGDEAAVEKKKCRDQKYRRMELDVLKYRNSEIDTGVKLFYVPAYNKFYSAQQWDGQNSARRSLEEEKHNEEHSGDRSDPEPARPTMPPIRY